MVLAIVGAKRPHGASLLTKLSLAARSAEFVFFAGRVLMRAACTRGLVSA